MKIRAANVEDRPAIIDLLRQSLGESTIPKSEALWCWKHEQNPFGASYVLLAEEDNQLIGLRAFMKWDWQWKGETFKTIRAVDTATHPAYQGKGIFKKLTLQQAEACKQQGVHFVFNTPNLQSKPGYLKMGWVEQGKMPLKIKVLQPVFLAYAKLFNSKKFADNQEDPSPPQVWDSQLFQLVRNQTFFTGQLTTVFSGQYIFWRYANNPLYRYNYFTDHENFLLITRIKSYSFTKELRFVDFFLLNSNADTKSISKKIKEATFRFCKENGVNVISLSGQQYRQYKPYFHWMGYIPVKPLGPVVTLRDLNMNGQFSELLNVQNWSYSLGDMELF